MSIRRAVAVLATALMGLVLGAGCTPSSRNWEWDRPTSPPAVDPLPPEMTEVTHSRYFAFAVPEEWEYCPGNECLGQRNPGSWAHGDGRLVVPLVSSGSMCPDAEPKSTIALNSYASRHLPDAYGPDGERSLRVKVPVTASRELDVPRAANAWQYEITDRNGMRHIINKVYLSGKVMTMYFLYMDEDTVAGITDTVVAATMASPWTPGDTYCATP